MLIDPFHIGHELGRNCSSAVGALANRYEARRFESCLVLSFFSSPLFISFQHPIIRMLSVLYRVPQGDATLLMM